MKNALTKNLARRRAARITEESDCLALVVSEETGRISMTESGGAVRGPAPGAIDRVSSFMKNALTKNLDWKVLSLPRAHATNPSLLTKLSTRRRVAIRITEESDCLALVVSEESGRISMTEFGDGVRGPAPGPVDRVSSFMKNALTKNLDWKVLSLPRAHATNPSLLTKLSTRRRAAIGITEKSDCLALIVSEETGRISMTESGNAVRGPAPGAVDGSSALPQSGFHRL